MAWATRQILDRGRAALSFRRPTGTPAAAAAMAVTGETGWRSPPAVTPTAQSPGPAMPGAAAEAWKILAALPAEVLYTSAYREH